MRILVILVYLLTISCNTRKTTSQLVESIQILAPHELKVNYIDTQYYSGKIVSITCYNKTFYGPHFQSYNGTFFHYQDSIDINLTLINDSMGSLFIDRDGYMRLIGRIKRYIQRHNYDSTLILKRALIFTKDTTIFDYPINNKYIKYDEILKSDCSYCVYNINEGLKLMKFTINYKTLKILMDEYYIPYNLRNNTGMLEILTPVPGTSSQVKK